MVMSKGTPARKPGTKTVSRDPVAASRASVSRSVVGSPPRRAARRSSPTRTARQAYSSAGSYAPTDIAKGMGANKTSSSVGVLEAEFFGAMVLIALTIVTDPKASSDYPSVMLAAMKRGTMIIILFFLLALLSAAGPNAGRAAKAFGGLVIVGLILAQANSGLFVILDNLFKSDWSSGDGSGGSQEGASSANAQLGTQTSPTGSVGSDIAGASVGGLTLGGIESGAEYALDPLMGLTGVSSAVHRAWGWLTGG